MSSMKSIKSRISNVSATKQIMKAMDMVSFTKLQKAKQRLEDARPLFEEIKRIIDEVKNRDELRDNKFIAKREIKNSLYIILTSDRGLCGSYNYNISQKALEHMSEGKNEQVLIVGHKGNEFFKSRDKNIMSQVMEQSEIRMYWDAKLISELVSSLYVDGDVDEVFIAYTEFETTLNYIPKIEKLLPLPLDGIDYDGRDEIKYEPNINGFLEYSIPMYLHAYLFAAMAESVTCEHASRMINMDSATKNATDIIDELGRTYNRKRQAAITQELNEIVSSADILS